MEGNTKDDESLTKDIPEHDIKRALDIVFIPVIISGYSYQCLPS